MLTAREIAKELNEDVAIIRNILSSINQEEFIAKEKAKFTYEIWDGKSEIQGIPASHWNDKSNLPDGGHMYMIRDVETGFVIQAQPFAPNAIGYTPMTLEQANIFAQKHIQTISEQAARAAIVRAVDLALDAV